MAKPQQIVEDVSLSDRNIVGIIQRELYELNCYLGRPAHEINKHVALRGVSEMVKFLQMLPEPTPVENGKSARN